MQLRSAYPTWCRWTGPGLGVLTGCVLFALRSRELTADSLNELRCIANAGGPLHPHHLLFAPIVRAIYLAVAAVLPGCDATLVAQAHGALWSGISVTSAYWILVHELGSPRAAVPWTLALAMSSGFLTFATQVEAYVPTIGCLLLLGATLLHVRSLPARTLAAISLYAAAVLIHQSAVLFAPALLILFRRGSTAGGSRARWLFPYVVVLLASGTLVLGAYFLAAGRGSLVGALHFASTYLEHPAPSWAIVDNVSPTGVGRLLRSQLLDVVHIRRTYTPGATALVGLFALWLGALAATAVVVARRCPETLARLLFPVAWLAACWAFFLWFLPGESDHFVQTVFPLLLFAALVLHGALRSPRLRRAGALVGIVMLSGGAVWNVHSVLLPRHRDPGPLHREAAALARSGLLERSLVLGEFGLSVHVTHQFGTPATVISSLVQGFYREDPEPAPYPERVVVSAHYVLPGHREGPYTGWSHPRGWLAFLRWLGALEPAGYGALASHATPALVATDLGERYLVFDRSRRASGDMESLLAALDALLAEAEPVFVPAGAEETGREEREPPR